MDRHYAFIKTIAGRKLIAITCTWNVGLREKRTILEVFIDQLAEVLYFFAGHPPNGVELRQKRSLFESIFDMSIVVIDQIKFDFE